MITPWLDRLGGLAGLVCAVHCGLIAFAPALLTLSGLEILQHEALEWAFFATALIFAGVAAGYGYRHHRNVWTLVGFGGCASVLIVARLAEAMSAFEGAAALAVTGGLALVGLHIVNAVKLRACNASCCESAITHGPSHSVAS